MLVSTQNTARAHGDTVTVIWADPDATCTDDLTAETVATFSTDWGRAGRFVTVDWVTADLEAELPGLKGRTFRNEAELVALIQDLINW